MSAANRGRDTIPSYVVGRVLRSSTTGYVVGCQVLEPQVPVFGSFVKVRVGNDTEVYGLIYDVRIDDDPFTRQLINVSELSDEYVRDQRENRQVPIEVSVLVIGFRKDGVIHHHLPPQPPLSLDAIYTCTDEEVVDFTQRFDYFRLVLEATQIPADETLAASLRTAAAARGGGESGRDFLIEAGRELARHLSHDLARLDGILRRLRR
jgi:predicted RNA-binding protein with RPS1 domain